MATAVKLNPNTGLPYVKVVSPPKTSGFTQVGGSKGVPGSFTPKPAVVPQPPAGFTWDFGPGNTDSSLSTGYQPAAGGGGGGGGGGGSPDYASLIANDPGFKALKAELAAGNISAAQFRTAAIQRAIIAYGAGPDQTGLDPQTAGFYKEDVTPGTLDLAAKNTAEGLSTTAQLDRAHQIAVNGLQNTLAARGMLQSGATGVGLGLEAQRNKEEVTGKQRELIDYLSGQASAYAEHLHQSKLQEAQGLMSTTQAYFGMAGGLGGAGGGAGGGDGSGGGGVTSDFIYDAKAQGGLSFSDYYNAALAGAPAGAKPMHIMNQGQIQNGTISIKYMMPNGQTNTISVPVHAAAPTTPNPKAPPPPGTNPYVAPLASIPSINDFLTGAYKRQAAI